MGDSSLLRVLSDDIEDQGGIEGLGGTLALASSHKQRFISLQVSLSDSKVVSNRVPDGRNQNDLSFLVAFALQAQNSMLALSLNVAASKGAHLGSAQSTVEQHHQNRIVKRTGAQVQVRLIEHLVHFRVAESLRRRQALGLEESDSNRWTLGDGSIIDKPLKEASERRQVAIDRSVLKVLTEETLLVTNQDAAIDLLRPPLHLPEMQVLNESLEILAVSFSRVLRPLVEQETLNRAPQLIVGSRQRLCHERGANVFRRWRESNGDSGYIRRRESNRCGWRRRGLAASGDQERQWPTPSSLLPNRLIRWGESG